ncbi:hypothetical protein CYMTET_39611 [Cymbomonas tetramitiformis]|uniref:Bacteriophage/plasmid primase P4 C-terminal domain-containing protein n=1 Tax=Cymbomonas tetramitiformis TaxID=36881 RepID=A0AAE0CC07_9CHLO|nr:hypothetical protein CYMTET_39611 [Cymbomonas tetramitiformis]
MFANADEKKHTLYFAVDKPTLPYINKNNKVEGLPTLKNGKWPELPHIIQQFVSFENRDEFLNFVNGNLGGDKNVMYEILREDRPCRMIADSDAILTHHRKDAGDTFTCNELCAALKNLTEWTFHNDESAVGDSDHPVEVRFVDGGCCEKPNGDTKLSVHMYVSGRALGHNKEHGEFVRACMIANAMVMYCFLLEDADHPFVKFCNLFHDLGVTVRKRYTELMSQYSRKVESPLLAREEAWPWHPEHLHLNGKSMSVKDILYQLAGEDDAPVDDRVHETVVCAIWSAARECIGNGLLDNMHTKDRVFRLVNHTKIFQNRPGRALKEVKTEDAALSSWEEVDMATIVNNGELHKFTATFDLDTAREPLIELEHIPAFAKWKSTASHRHLLYGGNHKLAAAFASAPRRSSESMSNLRLVHPELAKLLDAELADNVMWKKCLPNGSLKTVALPDKDFPNRLLVNTNEHECGWRGSLYDTLPAGRDPGPAHRKSTVYFLLTDRHIRKACTASWHHDLTGQNWVDIPYSSPERQTQICAWLRRLKPPTPRNGSPSKDEIIHDLDMELREEEQYYQEAAEEMDELCDNTDEASGGEVDGMVEDDEDQSAFTAPRTQVARSQRRNPFVDDEASGDHGDDTEFADREDVIEDDGAKDEKHLELFTDLCVNKANRPSSEQPYTMTVNKRKQVDGTFFPDEWMVAMTPCATKRQKCNENGKFISTYYTTDNRILADTCHDPTCPHHAPQRMISVANLDEYLAKYLKSNLVQNITNNVYNLTNNGIINGNVNVHHQQQSLAHSNGSNNGTHWDGENAKSFLAKYTDLVFQTKEFGLVMYNKDSGLWVTDKDEHSSIMYDSASLWEVARPSEKCSFTTIFNNTYPHIRGRAPRHAEFDDFGANQKGFLLFKNGVLDIRAGRMLPFDPKYRFMAAVPMSFDPLIDRSEMAKQVEEKIFKSMFLNPEKRKFVLETLSIALAGEHTKRMCWIVGEADCGKGVMVDLITNTYGRDIVGDFNANCFTSKKNSDSPERDLGFIVDLALKRISFSNEKSQITSGAKDKFGNNCGIAPMDGNLIKQLTGGRADRLRAREAYGKMGGSGAFHGAMRSFLCSTVNDLGHIVPFDSGMVTRTLVARADRTSTLESDFDPATHFRKDNKIFAFTAKKDVHLATVWMFMKIYQTVSPDESLRVTPDVVKKEISETCEKDENSVESWIRANYEVYEGDVYADFGTLTRTAKGDEEWKWNWTALQQAAGAGNEWFLICYEPLKKSDRPFGRKSTLIAATSSFEQT